MNDISDLDWKEFCVTSSSLGNSNVAVLYLVAASMRGIMIFDAPQASFASLVREGESEQHLASKRRSTKMVQMRKISENQISAKAVTVAAFIRDGMPYTKVTSPIGLGYNGQQAELQGVLAEIYALPEGFRMARRLAQAFNTHIDVFNAQRLADLGLVMSD